MFDLLLELFWDLAMQLSDLKSWRKSVIFFIIKRPSHVVHCCQEKERIHSYKSRRILAELATLLLEYALGQSPNKLSATEVVYSSEIDGISQQTLTTSERLRG